MAALLYGSRPDHFVLRCYVYSHHLCMCNRSCDGDHGHSLESDWQAGDPSAHTDWRNWTDRTCQHYFYFPEQEDQSEKPSDDPGILQSGADVRSGNSGEKSGSLCICSRRNRSSRLCILLYSKSLDLVKGLGQAVFTAISAFCNAGIDLLGENSLADYVTNPLVNIVTMGLIIASGLGFTVWWDLGKRIKLVFQKKLSPGRFFRTLRLQSKIVLTTTGILLARWNYICIFLFEYHNPDTLGKSVFWTEADGSGISVCDYKNCRIFYS